MPDSRCDVFDDSASATQDRTALKIASRFLGLTYQIVFFLISHIAGSKGKNFDHYYFEKLGFRPVMYWIASKLQSFDGLWASMDMEIVTYRLISELGPNDLVLDLGACIGAYTIQASKKVGWVGLVVAVEPNPINYRILRSRCEKLSNVVPIMAAVSTYDGHARLFTTEYFAGHTLLSNSGREDIGYTEVNVLTLESIMKEFGFRRVALMKCDIEGMEYPVLSSAPKSVLQQISRMIIAIHSEEDTTKIANVLLNAGFRVRILNQIRLLYAVYAGNPSVHQEQNQACNVDSFLIKPAGK